jgi:hypothetical protein
LRGRDSVGGGIVLPTRASTIAILGQKRKDCGRAPQKMPLRRQIEEITISSRTSGLDIPAFLRNAVGIFAQNYKNAWNNGSSISTTIIITNNSSKKKRWRMGRLANYATANRTSKRTEAQKLTKLMIEEELIRN